jgi:hypothetical protein
MFNSRIAQNKISYVMSNINSFKKRIVIPMMQNHSESIDESKSTKIEPMLIVSPNEQGTGIDEENLNVYFIV